PRPYAQLHQSHHELQKQLLRMAGDAEAYAAFVRGQEELDLLGLGTSEWNSYDYSYEYQRGSSEQADWRSSVRMLLLERGQFAELIKHGEALGAQLPTEAWGEMAAAHAALGNEQEATAWRRRIGDLALAQTAAADLPSLGGGRSWSWWWYR